MTEAANIPIPENLTGVYTIAKWAKTLQCTTVIFELTPDEIIDLAERLGKAEAECTALREQVERLYIALEECLKGRNKNAKLLVASRAEEKHGNH